MIELDVAELYSLTLTGTQTHALSFGQYSESLKTSESLTNICQIR